MFTPSGLQTSMFPGLAEYEHASLNASSGGGITVSWIHGPKPKKAKDKHTKKTHTSASEELRVSKSTKLVQKGSVSADDDPIPSDFLTRMAMFTLAHIVLQ